MSAGRNVAHWLRTNQGVGVLIAIAAALLFYYLWQQDWYHRVQRDRFSLGFFPGLGVVAIFVCAVAITVDQWRKEVAADMATVGWLDLGWALLFSGAGYILFQMMELLGLPLAATIFLFLLMTLLGVRPWYLAAGIGVGVAIIVFVLFSVLGIRLPGGFFPLLGI
ncbi:tripartite tricarboxylate transporter TctB family protein [Natronospirillum operosum]|uniref:Tripartite tricarboxylate transporter TctB family protein n=1 Tax=Natronospirillum operosum TaxID=2759953 RepID=A0A4Z0W8Q0_9GAMM|nr:tripartite tricarboxylate transporter TctB family protein [Natronospirillum operosum]TGG92398.1 tripartite tricarboxylate transporter TctB family protein [Natronospirillum operosum]